MKILALVVLLFGFIVAVPIAPIFAQDAPAQDAAAPAIRPVPKAAVKAEFDGLIGAIMDDNYTGFLVSLDEKLRGALTKPAFESVVGQVGPRLEAGFEATYLGQLQRKGYDVHLWKMKFETGDDLLVELSVKEGKVGGFFLR